jgi:transcriptional regulator with XRE-family HTH domain
VNRDGNEGNVPELPERRISVNQVVAWNLAWFRRARGLTQTELGQLVGLSSNAVSEAERSWAGKRSREFDADLLVAAAMALQVPVIALFLPPDEDGNRERYLISPGGQDGTMTDLMHVVVPDAGWETPIMDAYRKRFMAALTYYTEPEFAAQVARSLSEATDAEIRADQAAKLRAHRDQLLEAARQFGAIADEIEPGGAQ